MAHHLRSSLPGVTVLAGDARELSTLLPAQFQGRIGTVICGIPLVLLPVPEQKRFIDAIESVVSGFPGSSSVDALMAEAGKRGAELPAQVQEALFKMALVGLCTLTSEPVRATPAPSRKPVASALARYDAKRGDLATTNARHERIAFDSIGQVVLPALDGSNDVNALIEIVLQAVRAGRINFFRDGAPIADLAEREKIAIDQVRNLLPGFARGGLLEA